MDEYLNLSDGRAIFNNFIRSTAACNSSLGIETGFNGAILVFVHNNLVVMLLLEEERM